MTEKESAQAKHQKAMMDKAKAYKTPHDVERLHHLVAAGHIMRDYPAASALQASVVRELTAMTMRQMELDTAEKYEDEKAWQAAQAADRQAAAEAEEAANPPPKAKGK